MVLFNSYKREKITEATDYWWVYNYWCFGLIYIFWRFYNKDLLLLKKEKKTPKKWILSVPPSQDQDQEQHMAGWIPWLFFLWPGLFQGTEFKAG